MTFNKIILAMLVLMSASLFQSCLKDQEDIFNEPTSLRVQSVLDETKKILIDAPNGWLFEYFPDRNLSYGGFVYTVKFDEKEVIVGSELDPGEFESSLYKMTADNGPTLSFDTYNSLMHFFATPWGGGSFGYEAYDGDFEFAIMNATPDLVTLRGKRTGNVMYMRPLETDASLYLENIVNISDNMFLTSATGTAGQLDLEVTIDLDTRYMEFTIGDEVVGEYYLPTPTGIRFISPVKIGEATIIEFKYDMENMAYTGVDSNGNTVFFAGDLPAEYSKFDEFAGKYTWTYYNGSRKIEDVTFVPDKSNNCYYIQGLNANFEVVATYSKSRGCLEINSQIVATSGSMTIYLCAWDLKGGGSLSGAVTEGVYIIKDVTKENTFIFTPNGTGDLNTDSFILWATTSTINQGATATSPWVFTGGTGQMAYLYNLVKTE